MNLFLHSINKHLFNVYYIENTLVSIRDTKYKTDLIPAFLELFFPNEL